MHSLQQAVAEAHTSLTAQEGLYKAYRDHLLGIDAIEGLPVGLADSIRALLVDLRTAFGFDEVTRNKVRGSTLGGQGAALLLARLEAIAASAEVLAATAEPRRTT